MGVTKGLVQIPNCSLVSRRLSNTSIKPYQTTLMWRLTKELVQSLTRSFAYGGLPNDWYRASPDSLHMQPYQKTSIDPNRTTRMWKVYNRTNSKSYRSTCTFSRPSICPNERASVLCPLCSLQLVSWPPWHM